MKKANRGISVLKKRGRRGAPRTTGPGEQINVRCHTDFLARVDEWRKAPELSRPQAIRQLAEIGLKHETE
jgi:hypothetical protein